MSVPTITLNDGNRIPQVGLGVFLMPPEETKEHVAFALANGTKVKHVAPHGRLGTLRRPGNRWPGIDGLWLVGGTAHPGGGLPLVMLSGAIVAAQIGPA